MGATPYQALAPFYNRVMSHVDYPGWAHHIRALWRTYHGIKPPQRVLELAAGTCPFASPALFPKAFAVYSDLSPSMLGRAPFGANAPPLRIACDSRALSVKAPFDLVLMIYDSLNYLTEPDGVLSTMQEAHRVLRSGGLFIFDVTTEACSKTHFANAIDFEELEGCVSVRTSQYDAPSRTQLNLFTLFVAGSDGRYDRREEVHRQRVYPAAAVKKLARQTGFSTLACLADFTLKPGTDKNERLHFVLQKP
jgi:SAM-dependent methyltransferase